MNVPKQCISKHIYKHKNYIIKDGNGTLLMPLVLPINFKNHVRQKKN